MNGDKRGALGIGLQQASDVVDKALAHARESKFPPMTVVVLDAGGRMVAMKREDGSSLLRPEIAAGKAFGSLGMGMGSRALGERAQTHPAFVASITTLAGGQLIPVAGGVIVLGEDGLVLGAVGVSGALPDQDEECALKGIESVGLKPQAGGPHHPAGK